LKFFVVILALYVVGLTVMPCSDVYAVENPQTSITIMADNHNDYHEMDMCSPFCFCTCCQSLFESTVSEYMPSNPVAIPIDYNFIEKSYKNPVNSFWRPPKY